MPIIYKIDPALNLLYYACFGLCTGADFFQIERQAFQDKLRHPKMRIVFDIQNAEVDIDLEDIRNGIEYNRQLTETGYELEKTAVISKSKYGKTFSDFYHLFAEKVPIKFGVFNTILEAASWLEMPDSIEQILKISDSLHESFLQGLIKETGASKE
jgi:hypothetical protein